MPRRRDALEARCPIVIVIATVTVIVIVLVIVIVIVIVVVMPRTCYALCPVAGAPAQTGVKRKKGSALGGARL
jgi:polyferredoxin